MQKFIATKFIECAYDPDMTIDETPEIICYCTIQLYSKLIIIKIKLFNIYWSHRKLTKLTLRVHCEPLNSNWLKDCQRMVEFLLFSD